MRHVIVPILAFLFYFHFTLLAQQAPIVKLPTLQKEEFCAQSTIMETAFQRNPKYKLRHESIEHSLYQYLSNKSGKPQYLAPPPYVLPIVVHIIHDNGVENISDATVLQGVQDLNDAFANIGYYDPASGVDTKVQFCLAKRDPDGNATTGITRNVSPLTNMTLETDDITVKDLNRWDPTQYINIWLVKEICSNSVGCGVAGYAYFPSSHGMPEDGIMMEAEYFGSSQGSSGVQIHEMGHYLGLYHTFQGGCGNADCLANGDRVCDTPPDQSTAAVPCGTSVNSCTTDTDSGFSTDQNDLIEDYMDYGDFNCWSVFTQGQTDRMHWHIENIRPSLLQSQACLDPCTSALSASFSSSATSLEVGNSVSFTNNSTNSTSYEWEVDGVQFSTATSPSYTFNTVGNFEVCLSVGNADPNCSDRFCTSITVTCPVVASFVTGNLYPTVGQSVAFSNNSSNASNYDWKVNGTPSGNGVNLTYAFTNIGVNKVCLTAGNALCTQTFCQNVFVIDASGGGCDTSFLKTYGTLTQDEIGHAIVEIPAALGGGFLIGGGKADSAMITRLDVNANIVWTRAFDATPGADDYIWDISFDSDNNVIGSGQTRNEPDNNIECFVFKYNIATNNILWVNELDLNDPAQEVYYSVFEKSPGGNYIVGGTYDQLTGGTGCNGIILELNRNTGVNVWQHHYTLGSCETFQRTILHNNSFYATGRYNFDGGGTARMRPGVTKMDLNGIQQWSRLYLRAVTPATTARLYSSDIVADNGLVVLGQGDNSGTSTTNVTIFLFKTDNDGNLLWAMNYDIPGASSEFTTRLLNLPDGYLCLGYYNASSQDVFIFKTDKQGQLLWSKSYGSAADEDAFDMAFSNGQAYFTGRTKANTPGSTDDLYLANIGLDGNANALDSCNLFNDLNMSATPYPTPYNAQHNLTDLGLNWGQFITDKIVTETAVQSTTVCFEPCLDTCDVVPNAFFQTATAACFGDSLVVSLTACNLGAFDLPAGTPISFYLGNPTTTNANLLGVFALPQILAQNECGTFQLTVGAPPNTLIYAMLNDDGTTPRPFNLGTFMADVMECDYTNNLGSFLLDFTAPTLNLGPDVFLCENGVTELNAGAGFAAYLWQDGSTEQTYTAFGPGTYSVTVTDACGGQQTDEIVVTVDASTVLDLGPDVEVCSGGSYQFDVQGFATYQWSPADYLSCTDCPDPSSTPTSDVTYTLVATTAAGCISVDTIALTVGGIIESFEDVMICEGDTVNVFGIQVFQSGQYSQTFTSTSGCDSTVTVSVGLLPVVESFEDIQICQGDTALVFGMPITTDGQFSQVFTSAAGCDSTVTVSVGLLIPVSTQQSISICAGETADVFGNQIGVAGTYSQTFNGYNGCDSTHTILLSVNTVSVGLTIEDITCAELGFATATASGSTGPYSYEWSNSGSSASIGNLTAGSYTVTATDSNGCSSTATATIQGALGPGASINIISQVTEDEPDGGELLATVAGGTGPFGFEWNNGETTAEIDSLSSGNYTVTVTDANGCTATASAVLYVPACTGGKIWNDTDRDGCQDPGETGVGNVVLQLTGTTTTGQSIAANALSAINGEYIFTGLPPGTYFVKIIVPTGMALSQPNACGNTTSDSDFSTSTFLSGSISLVEGHCCLTIDGGIYDACLNLTTTGEICCDQTLCGPGNDPAPITSSIPAGGGGGPTQYMWMYSTIGGPMGVNWTNIPGATNASYDPGPLSQTTHFIRCAKSATCTTWLESNTVTIIVDDEAVADILSPGPICVNDPVSFMAAPNQSGATYTWNFGPWATPSSSSQPNPTVSFNQAGVTTITLTVVRNGCTSVDQLAVSISNNPSYCGTAVSMPGSGGGSFVPNPATASQLEGQFTVLPNPFGTTLTVAWGEEVEAVVNVKLYSMDGRLLHSAQSGNGELNYVADLTDLSPGVYLLRLQTPTGETGIFKVVKE